MSSENSFTAKARGDRVQLAQTQIKQLEKQYKRKREKRKKRGNENK